MFITANYLQSRYGATWSLWYHLIAGSILGMSMSATFVIILQVAFTGINEALSNDAAGVFNFFRNIGNSVGTSIASTVISRQQQVAWNDMASHINPFNPVVQSAQTGMLSHLPLVGQVQTFSMNVMQQAFIIANIDVYSLAYHIVLILAIIPFFLAKPAQGVSEVHMH